MPLMNQQDSDYLASLSPALREQMARLNAEDGSEPVEPGKTALVADSAAAQETAPATAPDVKPEAQPATQTQEPQEPAAKTASPAPANPEDDPNSETWRHKWATADGVAKATGRELSKAQRLAQDLQEQVQRLQARVADLEAAPKPAAQPAASSDPNLLADLAQDFDESTVAKIMRAIDVRASEIADARVAAKVEPIVREQQAQRQQQDESDFEKYLDELYGAVPNAYELFNDPNFRAFVGKGGIQTIEANERDRNAQGVINVLRLYTERVKPDAPSAPPAAPATTPAPAPVKPSAQQRLEAQIMPEARPTQAPTGEPKQITPQEAQRQFQDLRGKFGRGEISYAEYQKQTQELSART